MRTHLHTHTNTHTNIQYMRTHTRIYTHTHTLKHPHKHTQANTHTHILYVHTHTHRQHSKKSTLPGSCAQLEVGVAVGLMGNVVSVSVLSSWGVQDQRPRSSRALVPDFVSLNQEAVRSGAVTSKQLTQFRARVGVAKNQNHTPKSKAARIAQSSVLPPDGAFGGRSQR